MQKKKLQILIEYLKKKKKKNEDAFFLSGFTIQISHKCL